MIFPLVVLILILLALASPAMSLKNRSWKWLPVAMVLSFLVVVLPLFFFFVSGFLEPKWKGACKFGWLDCFIAGKIALAPLALWATAALYKTDVLRAEVSKERWVVLGIFVGAIVALVCLIFGFVCLGYTAWPGMLVPLYVAVWYGARAVQLIRAADFDFLTYLTAALGTIPFWLGSWFLANNLYEALPNVAPGDCFVVTAAGRGHRKFVGPFFEIERGGRRRQANQQLLTFWQFESLWRRHFPLSHRVFRSAYNRFGPRMAARIKSPWAADAAFIALKPVELVAGQINRYFK